LWASAVAATLALLGVVALEQRRGLLGLLVHPRLERPSGVLLYAFLALTIVTLVRRRFAVPPAVLLYAMGYGPVWERGWPDVSRCVAVVGSRNPTAQGSDNALAFAQSLAQEGMTVVSGMALGVDAAAHRGALAGADPDGGVPTIAVVGTGLDRVYPSQHHTLAQQIAQRGVILSEYALGTAPLAAHFPRRNRLISGLCQGTLVVEAALKSGSLITAEQALEQGRDVFAIPGSIHSTQSRGCHALIKQGAHLVESVQDILGVMDIATAATGRTVAFSLSTCIRLTNSRRITPSIKVMLATPSA
jgi:DNA processing protein